MNCNEKIKKSKIKTIVWAIVVAVGVVACIVGIANLLSWGLFLMIVGAIMFLLCGYFFICAFNEYRDYLQMSKVIRAVTDKSEISIEELASACGLNVVDVRKYVNLCFKNQLLEQHTRIGENVVLKSVSQKMDKKTIYVKCKKCGAVVECQEGVFALCEYCGSPLDINSRE